MRWLPWCLSSQAACNRPFKCSFFMCISRVHNFLQLLAASKASSIYEVAHAASVITSKQERILGLSILHCASCAFGLNVSVCTAFLLLAQYNYFCYKLVDSSQEAFQAFFVRQRQRGTWDETHAEERYNFISTI